MVKVRFLYKSYSYRAFLSFNCITINFTDTLPFGLKLLGAVGGTLPSIVWEALAFLLMRNEDGRLHVVI